MTALSHPSRVRAGFTLLELLVVIGLILATIGVLLPAIGQLVSSSNYASAINAVTSTLGNARALAVSTGTPTGVIFLYDARDERYTLQTVVYDEQALSAKLSDLPSDCLLSNGAAAFRPAPNTVPVDLPRRTGVFALCFTHERGQDARRRVRSDCRIDSRPTFQWYAGEVINGDDDDPDDDIIPWIFPRNDPRLFAPQQDGQPFGVDPWDALRPIGTSPALAEPDAIAAIRSANSFMIQFDATGVLTTSTALGGQDLVNAYLELSDAPLVVSSASTVPYDSGQRFDPENFKGIQPEERSPNREVILRSASQLAVVDLARLEDGVGFPRPWLFRPSSSKAASFPWIWGGENTSASQRDERVRAVSRWIDLNAEIIGFNRYSGNIIRRGPR